MVSTSPMPAVCATFRLTSSALEVGSSKRAQRMEVTHMTRTNRIALVTGASRGLGLVIARVLAGRGYGLVIGGRDRVALSDAAADLSRDAPAVLPVAGDITEPPVRAALIAAAERLGGLNVLVNNAAELGPIGPL